MASQDCNSSLHPPELCQQLKAPFCYDVIHLKARSSQNTYGKEFVAVKNLYFDTASSIPGSFARQTPFPGGMSWKEWQGSGHDLGSSIADPGFADAANNNFSFGTGRGTAANSLGIMPLNVDNVGPDW